MLSKSRAHVLRISAAMHFLFHYGKDVDQIPSIISKEAMLAAIDYVKLCCYHTSVIAGRGSIDDEVQKCQNGINTSTLLVLIAKKFTYRVHKRR